jgi:hypothetical protein
MKYLLRFPSAFEFRYGAFPFLKGKGALRPHNEPETDVESTSDIEISLIIY